MKIDLTKLSAETKELVESVMKEKADEVSALTVQLTESKTQNDTLVSELTTVKTELAEAVAKISAYDAEKALIERKNFVQTKITEAKISEIAGKGLEEILISDNRNGTEFEAFVEAQINIRKEIDESLNKGTAFSTQTSEPTKTDSKPTTVTEATFENYKNILR